LGFFFLERSVMGLDSRESRGKKNELRDKIKRGDSICVTMRKALLRP